MQRRTDIASAFGAAVSRLRHERRLSQEALAFEADLHPTYISSIERGERSVGLEPIIALAHAFDMTASQLMALAEEILRSRAE
ncbi:MAG: helix-turn-helix domain-containing protein [Solirubrobacteraceae bacterium]